jgi:hypothetical protein
MIREEVNKRSPPKKSDKKYQQLFQNRGRLSQKFFPLVSAALDKIAGHLDSLIDTPKKTTPLSARSKGFGKNRRKNA